MIICLPRVPLRVGVEFALQGTCCKIEEVGVSGSKRVCGRPHPVDLSPSLVVGLWSTSVENFGFCFKICEISIYYKEKGDIFFAFTR